MTRRQAILERTTNETSIRAQLDLDGTGKANVTTGIGFLDHLISTIIFHARCNLELLCEGDLQVDDHHSAEDCAIVIGEALNVALGDRIGIVRFGYAYAPLDEALARAVVDMAGRNACVAELGLKREHIGELACENIPHLFRSIASAARCAIHIDVLRGDNDHHRAEAAAKAFALALKQAISRSESKKLPSTKGAI